MAIDYRDLISIHGKYYVFNGVKSYTEGDYLSFNTLCNVHLDGKTRGITMTFSHPTDKSIHGTLRKNLAVKYATGMIINAHKTDKA